MNPPASCSLLNRKTRLTTFGAALGLLSITARPALVVNTDLGTLGAGSVNLTGTTVGGANNANNYSNTNPAVFWGSEFVYQFTTNVRAAFSVTSDDPNAGIDNDFFLLSGLATTPSGAINIGAALGNLVEVSGGFGVFDAGTYFLSIDAFASVNSSAPGNAGPFNASFTIAPIVAPASALAIPGGSISTTLAAGEVLWFSFNHPGGAFAVDTIGSTLAPDNDTELFLFDSGGNLNASNDDMGGGSLFSRITNASLAAGAYYLAAAGYDSAGSAGFNVTSTSGEAGGLVINGLTVIPEPATGLMALAAGAFGLARRRRA